VRGALPPSDLSACTGSGSRAPDALPGDGGAAAAGGVGGAGPGGERCAGDVIGREALAVSRVEGGGWSGLSPEEEAEAAAALRKMEEKEDLMRHEVRKERERRGRRERRDG
jgi:hypothetical protein